MKINLYIKSVDSSKGYVSNIVPLEYSSVKSKAKVLELNICPLDADEVELNIWKNIEKLIDQTSSMDWTIYIESDTGTPIGVLRLDDSRIAMSFEEGIDAATVKAVRELCCELTAYLMSKALDLAISSVVGTATAVPDADADADTSVAASASGIPSSSDIDHVIDKIKKQSKADIVKPKETLVDYVCDASLKEELMEVKNFFENASTYKSAGIRIPKGILFKGVPGTGKTYAARCIAGDVDCYFMTCTASSLQGMYIGSGAENIRNVFEGAKALRKASGKGVIIFFDELDSLGSRETHNGGASGEEDRTLNQLLAELSGFEDAEGIMVLGATNYPERIDDALMRSGRFSRQITIEVPGEDERRNLVDYYFKKLTMNIDDECTVEDVTALTESLTPADISEIINEAGILAIREKRHTVYISDVNEAINKVITKNIRKPDKDIEYQKLVAVHEIGHVVAEYLYGNSISVKVTNYSYGDAGGFTQPGEHSKGIITEKEYKARALSLLGGRAAEQVMLGYVTTGASSDMDRARKQIRRFYEVYHFDTYRHEDFEQTVLDTMTAWYNECVELFQEPEVMALIGDLTTQLGAERVLYAKDIAATISKHPGAAPIM